MSDEFHQLLVAYERERPAWVQVANWLRAELQSLVSNARLPAEVSSRAKETSSLVLTGYRKGKTDLALFHDRAAGRIATYYADDRPLVIDLVHARFGDCVEVQDHGAEQGDSVMGYRGVHLDVTIERNDLGEWANEIEGPIWCEIQVHSLASNLWAATGHPLVYKGPVEASLDLRRLVNQLSVLTEIYDARLTEARIRIADHPDYPAGRILEILERYYFSLFGQREHDADFSRFVVERLMPTLDEEEVKNFDLLLLALFEDHRDNLDFIYRGQDPATQYLPILMQPEALLFFERLTHRQAKLREVWLGVFPEQWYDELVAVWGGSSG